jgi:Na+-transporting NADH:ubiquinone oxidoreductase subunit NqrA
MLVLVQNKATQKLRDQHGVGMPLNKERDEIMQRLKNEGQWQTFKEREDALQEMRERDPRVAKMVMMKAKPFTTPEELLSLFEKGLRIIEPRRKLLTELEAERRVVAS